MQVPVQVTFRHMERSAAIEALIREKVAKLDSCPDHIMGCRVVVGPAGKHHEHGNLYEVRIDLTVPGEEIAVVREPGQHTQYRDINVAIRDAFDSARRQLEDYLRRRRGAVKVLETAPQCPRQQTVFRRRLRFPLDAGRPGNLLPSSQRLERRV